MQLKKGKVGLTFVFVCSATGRPTSLTLEYLMDFGTLPRPNFIMGLAFSNIVNDPNTGFGLLFTFLGDSRGPLVTLPLIENGQGFYDVDAANVQYLCTPPSFLTTGSLDLIPSGNQANNYIVTHYNNGALELLDIDPSTGFPVGNPSPVLLSNFQTDIDCPLTELVGDTFSHYASKFDSQGTGDFFTANWGGKRAEVFALHGFPPGYNVDIVSANLAATLDALLQDISANARRLSMVKDKPMVEDTPRNSNNAPVNRSIKLKQRSLNNKRTKKNPEKPEKNPGKPKKKPEKPKNKPSCGGFVSKRGKKTSSCEPEDVGQQQTDAVLGSLAVAGVEVTPEVEAAVTIATNPGASTLVQDAISTGVSSTELSAQMDVLDNLVADVLPAVPTPFQQESADYITCATNKIRNTATPSLVSGPCTLPSSPPS